MKDFSSIDSYLAYGSIFKECRNEATGKIDWQKISCYEDLPADFIDKYYYQLKSYSIESKQKFPEWLIVKNKSRLNWAMLIKSAKTDINESIVTKCIDAIFSMNFLFYVLKRVKLSLAFFESNWKYVLAVPNWKTCIGSNLHLTALETQQIISFLESKESSLLSQEASPHAPSQSL